MIVLVLGALVPLLGVLLFMLRDEAALARLWDRLAGAGAATLRRTIDLQVTAHKETLSARRAQATEATSLGTPLEAARLLGVAQEVGEQHRVLVALRRMLSALSR